MDTGPLDSALTREIVLRHGGMAVTIGMCLLDHGHHWVSDQPGSLLIARSSRMICF